MSKLNVGIADDNELMGTSVVRYCGHEMKNYRW